MPSGCLTTRQTSMTTLGLVGVHNHAEFDTPEYVHHQGGRVGYLWNSVSAFSFSSAPFSALIYVGAGRNRCSASWYASHSAWKTSSCRGMKPSLASSSVSQCDSVPMTEINMPDDIEVKPWYGDLLHLPWPYPVLVGKFRINTFPCQYGVVSFTRTGLPTSARVPRAVRRISVLRCS